MGKLVSASFGSVIFAIRGNFEASICWAEWHWYRHFFSGNADFDKYFDVMYQLHNHPTVLAAASVCCCWSSLVVWLHVETICWLLLHLFPQRRLSKGSISVAASTGAPASSKILWLAVAAPRSPEPSYSILIHTPQIKLGSARWHWMSALTIAMCFHPFQLWGIACVHFVNMAALLWYGRLAWLLTFAASQGYSRVPWLGIVTAD